MSAYAYVFLGLSFTSSWGHGHATTYRGLLKALARRGHDVLFLEREQPDLARSRDLPYPPFGRVELYGSVAELARRFGRAVRDADLVVLGSYVPEGARIAAWMTEIARARTAFYDLDTPLTLACLERGEHAHLTPALVPRFDLYLSFTGGPPLDLLARRFGARRARPLHGSVDPELHYPEPAERRWDLGYLGAYGADRQPGLERLLLEPARRAPEHRFAVAGARYPDELVWPANVERFAHLPPGEHRAFYGAQRFALHVTRRDLALAAHAPSVRLFEAAACAVPVISDPWPGLEALFEPDHEILVARSPEDTLRYLREVPDAERDAIGEHARARVLSTHTAAHRAETLEEYTRELVEGPRLATARLIA